jgi:predicted NUDIX family NTP pyrophosphohydrolase
MMPKRSAGLLIYRIKNKKIEVLLVHPGGPLWAKKDLASWSIPKGEIGDRENPLDAAIREVKEETGISVSGRFIALSPIKQKSGKWVYAWAHEEDVDISQVKSNTFELEWPPKSGKKTLFPEIDKAEWFTTKKAKEKIIDAQALLIDELEIIIKNK